MIPALTATIANAETINAITVLLSSINVYKIFIYHIIASKDIYLKNLVTYIVTISEVGKISVNTYVITSAPHHATRHNDALIMKFLIALRFLKYKH
ncbi:hypothetical protein psyc5s11_50770 [Clostridium gelidum]|uniref:Uncharacterized protein n=1 Tax=Clostridium gelidum TaxID=704125 RepID=A0ABN6J5Z0_9CLOT|nr:hypothetical protein psyc5s11_50770 [Clostridium gelidum]